MISTVFQFSLLSLHNRTGGANTAWAPYVTVTIYPPFCCQHQALPSQLSSSYITLSAPPLRLLQPFILPPFPLHSQSAPFAPYLLCPLSSLWTSYMWCAFHLITPQREQMGSSSPVVSDECIGKLHMHSFISWLLSAVSGGSVNSPLFTFCVRLAFLWNNENVFQQQWPKEELSWKKMWVFKYRCYMFFYLLPINFWSLCYWRLFLQSPASSCKLCSV